jgi:hypothetical protein
VFDVETVNVWVWNDFDLADGWCSNEHCQQPVPKGEGYTPVVRHKYAEGWDRVEVNLKWITYKSFECE